MSAAKTPEKRPFIATATSGKASKKLNATETEVKLLLRIKNVPFCERVLYANDLRAGRVDFFDKPTAAGRPPRGGTFFFDRVFPAATTNAALFDDCLPTLDDGLFTRKSLLFLAYGNTNSGKTHTILGTAKESGILQSALGHLLRRAQSAGIRLCFSALEVYNEKVSDLIVGGAVADGAAIERPIESAAEIDRLIARIAANRKTAETFLNKQSSRSHCLYRVALTFPDSAQRLFVFVDLAGAERSKYLLADECAPTTQLAETCQINKSLLCLSRCFMALRERRPVPYRETRLTRLLFEQLSDALQIVFLIAFNPGLEAFEDNLRVLEFAALIKRLRPADFEASATLSALKARRGRAPAAAAAPPLSQLRARLLDSRLAFAKRQIEGLNAASEALRALKRQMMDEWVRNAEAAFALSFAPTAKAKGEAPSFLAEPSAAVETRLRELYTEAKTPVKRASAVGSAPPFERESAKTPRASFDGFTFTKVAECESENRRLQPILGFSLAKNGGKHSPNRLTRISVENAIQSAEREGKALSQKAETAQKPNRSLSERRSRAAASENPQKTELPKGVSQLETQTDYRVSPRAESQPFRAKSKRKAKNSRKTKNCERKARSPNAERKAKKEKTQSAICEDFLKFVERMKQNKNQI